MTDDNVFRAKVEPSEESSVPEKEGKGETTHKTDVQAPYLDYERINHHPYIVDHFKLGDTWQDKLGGFEKEVETIEGYFKGKIEQGELKNDTESVSEKLKSIYKLCGIDKTERTTMQIEKLAAYVEFLRKTDTISLNHNKYS